MESARVQRKLAAILCADVAGYSRLMGADEEGALRSLNGHRRELFDPCIASHRGRIFKTTGDGLLAEFGSAVDAVRCAIEIQTGMLTRNSDVNSVRRLEFRIGINVGDVVDQDGDIFGDGVNIAARLQEIAEPGGICVSGRVQEDAAGKVEFLFEDLGEPSLKNIARPIRAYRLRPGGAADRSQPSRPALRLPYQPSIAVLPFREHERRSRAGLFRRRHGRRDHHGAVSRAMAVRHRAQFELHLQGPRGGREASGPRTRACAMCSKAACARPATGCASRASSSMRQRAANCGRTGSTGTWRTSSICKIR